MHREEDQEVAHEPAEVVVEALHAHDVHAFLDFVLSDGRCTSFSVSMIEVCLK